MPNGIIAEAVAIRSKVYALKIKKLNFDKLDEDSEGNEESYDETDEEGSIIDTDEEIDDQCFSESSEDDSEDSDDPNTEIMKRMKGVRRLIVKERIAFSDFRKTLYGCSFYISFHKIASKKHSVSTVMCRKRAMTAFDDKRWILPCRIHSFSYGSIEIKKFKGQCPTCN